MTAVDLDISLAGEEEIDALLDLYTAVQEATAGTDNDPQWRVGVHPSREELEEAARRDELVVGRVDGQLAAVFIMNDEGAGGYDDVPWTIPAAPGEYGVVHLLAVHPAFRGRGLARLLMDAASDLAKQRGMKALRLDTLASNYGAQRVYEHLGFKRFGPMRLAYGTYVNTSEFLFVMYERAV